MDIIQNIEGSVVQHGPHNNRIYLIKLKPSNTHSLITTLDEMAIKFSYGKIFAKIPEPSWHAFKSAGYIKEAVVPRFFTGKIDGFFIAKYVCPERQKEKNSENQFRLASQAREKATNSIEQSGRVIQDVVSCKPSDVAEMSAIYQKIFKSYPFPIQKPAYLERMMREGVLYYCIRIEGKMAAIAAAEIDLTSQNVEMTDFATSPKWRGLGLAGMLLDYMDRKVRKLGIKTAYTIARAESKGMNSVFDKNGYNYAGLLKNNSQICGSIQSMTVWYKHL